MRSQLFWERSDIQIQAILRKFCKRGFSVDVTRPFEGIKIIELSTMITAAQASLILGGQGAETIKVEPLGTGDPLRVIGSQKKQVSAFYSNFNRGKRSLVVELKDQRGQEIVQRLAHEADILISNYRPGVLNRLGLGYDTLSAQNPNLIYMAISGFGETGPMSSAPAYDHVIQAMTGFTAVQGMEQKPDYIRTPLCDKITGYTAAQALSAALYTRERQGRGQFIELSMLEACLAFIWPDGLMHYTMLDPDVMDLVPFSHYYQILELSDGYLACSPLTDAHWEAIFTLLDRPELRDNPLFATAASRLMNAGPVMAEIGNGRVNRTVKEALKILATGDVPCGASAPLPEVHQNPQIVARESLEEFTDTDLGHMRVPRPPVRFDGQKSSLPAAGPLHGKHTLEILSELGYQEDQIEKLEQDGVVKILA